MSSRASLTLAAVATLSLLAAAPANQDRDDFTWSGTLESGQRLEIKNVNGPLLFEPSDGDTVHVTATKQGPSDDIEEVHIDVVEHDGGVTICSIFPKRWGFGSNECKPGKADLGGNGKNKTKVTFRVQVPAGVEVNGRTMNGAIEAAELQSDVRLLTMNGRITVSTSGWASAKTMNGAIDCSMGSADWSGDIELESMNGGITVHMPADAGAEVSATTMNGRVNSDWKLEKGGWIRNKAHGTIDGGGRGLEISTMNGSIEIRKGS